jgi:hypothetical protein
MPSPFPGMDPYLEDPHSWPGFHNKFAAEMEAALNVLIVPAYYAEVEERVYISDEEDPGRRAIVPDVRILPSNKKNGSHRRASASPSTALCEPVEVITLIEEEIHELYLTVVERKSRQVVTVIEILSPTNKIAGSRGREQYTSKRADVLHSEVHWVEIDLLREGEPVVARDLYPRCEYTVHVSRNGRRPKGTIWPIRIQNPLPAISIPLKGNDPDVMLPLQPILDSVYDRSAYHLKLDYSEDPVPPLSPELARWSNKLLKQKKLR